MCSGAHRTVSALLLVLAMEAAQSQGIDSQAVASAQGAVAPAIALVRYTQLVTDPRDGSLDRRDGMSLGVIVTADGLVMTQGHLIRENVQLVKARVVVGPGDGEITYPAVVLQKPLDINVVFLQMEPEQPRSFPFLHFTHDDKLSLGTPVLVFGMLAESLDYARIFTERRVGAVLRTPRTTYCLDDAVHFAAIGGPVVNARGEAIGVVGFDLSAAEGGELFTRSGHPLIFQTALFSHYIANPPGISAYSETSEEAWLGVFTQPLTDDFATYWGLPKRGGLIVSTVIAGSPAAEAGMQPGDIITRFNEVPVVTKVDREVANFTRLVRDAGLGARVPVEFLRDGEAYSLHVTLEARPASSREAEIYEDSLFGMTLRELTTDVRIRLNLPESMDGVIVSQVRSGGAAQEAGMRPGAVILRLDDWAVRDLTEYRAAVTALQEEQPEEVAVFARQGAATGFMRIEPQWTEGD